mmetsp:Transcript_21266/g.45194  ORF Transcript_21266/g.45194 Transcript_21266/m.45194 type:complete len:155 (-) Transcript_21266:57-521(-)
MLVKATRLAGDDDQAKQCRRFALGDSAIWGCAHADQQLSLLHRPRPNEPSSASEGVGDPSKPKVAAEDGGDSIVACLHDWSVAFDPDLASDQSCSGVHGLSGSTFIIHGSCGDDVLDLDTYDKYGLNLGRSQGTAFRFSHFCGTRLGTDLVICK